MSVQSGLKNKSQYSFAESKYVFELCDLRYLFLRFREVTSSGATSSCCIASNFFFKAGYRFEVYVHKIAVIRLAVLLHSFSTVTFSISNSILTSARRRFSDRIVELIF